MAEQNHREFLVGDRVLIVESDQSMTPGVVVTGGTAPCFVRIRVGEKDRTERSRYVVKDWICDRSV